MSKGRLTVLFLHALLFFLLANGFIMPFELSYEVGDSPLLLLVYYLLEASLIVLWLLLVFGAKKGIYNKKDIFVVSGNFYLKVVYFIAGVIVIIWMKNLCFHAESFIEGSFIRTQSNIIISIFVLCCFLIPFLYTSKKIFGLEGIQSNIFKKIILGVILSLLYFIFLLFSLWFFGLFIIFSHRGVFENTWKQMLD